MSRCFCDLNVLLDSILKRPPWQADADIILAAARAGDVTLCISALTLANLHYVARRQIGTDPARQAARDLSTLAEILPLDRACVQRADTLAGPDFEDDIQLACAILGGVDAIVTRDPRGFTRSPIPVLRPADLVARLSTPPEP